MAQIKVKSDLEILARLKELLQRHRKRYVKARLKPKGSNCAHKVWDDVKKEWFCEGCGSRDPEVCLNPMCFEPELTKEELAVAFREDICNTQRMLRDYRDIATLLWVLSQFDDPAEYERTKEGLIGMEQRQTQDTLEKK
jgi:hypothetical protein